MMFSNHRYHSRGPPCAYEYFQPHHGFHDDQGHNYQQGHLHPCHYDPRDGGENPVLLDGACGHSCRGHGYSPHASPMPNHHPSEAEHCGRPRWRARQQYRSDFRTGHGNYHPRFGYTGYRPAPRERRGTFHDQHQHESTARGSSTTFLPCARWQCSDLRPRSDAPSPPTMPLVRAPPGLSLSSSKPVGNRPAASETTSKTPIGVGTGPLSHQDSQAPSSISSGIASPNANTYARFNAPLRGELQHGAVVEDDASRGTLTTPSNSEGGGFETPSQRVGGRANATFCATPPSVCVSPHVTRMARLRDGQALEPSGVPTCKSPTPAAALSNPVIPPSAPAGLTSRPRCGAALHLSGLQDEVADYDRRRLQLAEAVDTPQIAYQGRCDSSCGALASRSGGDGDACQRSRRIKQQHIRNLVHSVWADFCALIAEVEPSVAPAADSLRQGRLQFQHLGLD